MCTLQSLGSPDSAASFTALAERGVTAQQFLSIGTDPQIAQHVADVLKCGKVSGLDTIVGSVLDICELRIAGRGRFEINLLQPLSLIALRDSEIGKELLHRQDWYNGRDWAQAQVPAGKYEIRMPIPGSNSKTFSEQCALLNDGESLTPVALAALALLCLRKAGHRDPLNGGWVRCGETTAVGRSVVLTGVGGRLYVNDAWGGRRRDLVWLASVRTLPA